MELDVRKHLGKAREIWAQRCHAANNWMRQHEWTTIHTTRPPHAAASYTICVFCGVPR